MSYATVAQVQAYVPLLPISSGSTPSSAAVQTFLDDRSETIDAALASRGYAVPVTAPSWFVEDLARLNAEGAAGDVWLAAFISAPGINASANGQARLKNYMDRVSELRQGIGVPVGAAYQEVDQAVRSEATGPTACIQGPLFRRHEVWE